MKRKTKFLLVVILLEIIILGGLLLHPNVFRIKGFYKFIHTPYYQLIFKFNQPIIKTSFEENFQINPDVEGDFVWQDFNRQVSFRPAYLEYDTSYIASIQNIKSYALTEIKKQIFEFKVISPSSLNLAKITPNKLPRAKKNIFIKSDGQVITLQPPQITKGKYIDVDIDNQVLAIYQDNRIKGVYEVSTGQAGMPTPVGGFNVLNKEENHWSVKYSLFMPYSLRFFSDFYIHELPYWPNGYREGTEHLGMRVSHGCIRLGIGPAKEVYDFAEIGTPVVIH